MINQKSIKTIENEAYFSKEFIKPLYHSYNIIKVIEIIKYLFGINNKINFPYDLINVNKKPKKIIVFLIDGFGWRFIEEFKDHPFIQWIIKNGILSKITSQFPSTTSAHVTLFHTGQPVGKSGIYEWYYYEPKIDDIICPLLFSFAGDQKRDTLKKVNIKPEKILSQETFYQLLDRYQIHSYIFQSREYTPSTYSNCVFKKANVIPYRTLSEGITWLINLFNQENNPAYFFLYFDKIDSISHTYGPNSFYVKNEITNFLTFLEKIFLPFLENNRKETVFLMTADHGHMNVDPATTFYLNKRIPSIKKFLLSNKNGKLLVPAGSPRDLFLYVKKEFLFQAKKILEKRLKGIAEVYLTNELIENNFFGEKISRKFLSHLGNLVVLPYENRTVWWFEKNRFEMKFFGHHGGLSKEEMEVGLFFV